MTPTLDPPVALVTGPKYYRSFASYEVPFRPVEPAAFADTEGLRSYYAAYYDRAGRVVRFDKRRLVRVAKEPRLLPLSGVAEHGSAVYFASKTDTAAREPSPGEQLDYPEIEGHDEFFAGVVEASGRDAKVTRFRLEVAFTDVYAYWPDGRLRYRVKWEPDREAASEYYDTDGNRVGRPVPYAWEKLIERGIAEMEAGDPPARATLEAALRGAERDGSVLGIARVLNRLARFDAVEGRYADAVEKLKRVIPVWSALNEPHQEMASWYTFGAVERAEGKEAADRGERDEAERHYSTARHSYENVIRLAHRHGNKGNEADALQAQAYLADIRGDLAEAGRLYEQSARISHDLNKPAVEVDRLVALCSVRVRQGDYEAAREVCEQALPLVRVIGDRLAEAEVWRCMGAIAYHQGRYSAMMALFSVCYLIVQQVGDAAGAKDWKSLRVNIRETFRIWKRGMGEDWTNGLLESVRDAYEADQGLSLIRHAFFEPPSPEEQRFDAEVAAATTGSHQLLREGLDAAARSALVGRGG